MMLKRFFILFLMANNCGVLSARVNLALNKSYTLSPKPNYKLCTDESDVIQLTDGKTYGSNGSKESTVGWWKPDPIAEIVVDLGERYAVDEVQVYTIGGGFANVNFPEFISVLLSDDGREFRFAGLISSKHLADVRSVGFHGVPRMMSVGNISAVGRYVKLVIKPRPYHIFLDEIEVFGDSLSVAKNVRFRDELDIFKTSEELLSRVEGYLQLNENIVETIKSVKENQSRLSGELSEKILSALEILAQKVDVPSNKMYSNDELLYIKDNLGKIRARIYEAVYGKPFVCQPANPMEIVFEKEMCFPESLKEINIQLWQNEYESAAFNIINCSDEAITMFVSISPLMSHAGEAIDSNKTFTIRRSIYVKGATIGSIADALVLQSERPFILQPGELTQIWLTVFNPMLMAGNYEGQIAISAKTVKGKVLPIETIVVTVKVQKNKFPENAALNTYNWPFCSVASVPETAEDLHSHHINVYSVGPKDIPFPRYASDHPGIVRKPNFLKLGKVLQDHNYATAYLFTLNFRQDEKDYGRFGQWMTPSWKAAFSSWLIKLVDYLKDVGVDYDKFILHSFDETLCDEFFEFAKFVKSVDPKIRLFANYFGEGPEQFMRFRPFIDVWCPADRRCIRHPEWLEMIKSFGKEVWTYECLGPAKANDPYSYYRLLPWRAFKRGQTGAGFWVYHDGLDWKDLAVPWDDTLEPYGYYGVIYGPQTSPVGKLADNIVPSRRWEAWREGVEDYQYLYELQQAINNIKVTNPAMANRAQETIECQVNQVLNNQHNSDIVYEARRTLSDELIRLTGRKNDPNKMYLKQ